MESTPIPVAAQFVLDEDGSLFGALKGNAFNGDAKLDLFLKDEGGPSHLEINGLVAIARLSHQLNEFLDAMQSKGSH